MDPFQIINKSTKLIAYFSFPECSVCKVLRPKIENLVKNYHDVDFLYIDTHHFPAAAGQYLVFAAPTVIYFEGGRERERWSRVFSVSAVQEALDRFSNNIQPSAF